MNSNSESIPSACHEAANFGRQGLGCRHEPEVYRAEATGGPENSIFICRPCDLLSTFLCLFVCLQTNPEEDIKHMGKVNVECYSILRELLATTFVICEHLCRALLGLGVLFLDALACFPQVQCSPLLIRATVQSQRVLGQQSPPVTGIGFQSLRLNRIGFQGLNCCSPPGVLEGCGTCRGCVPNL